MQLSLKILTFTSHTLYACRQHKIFASFFLDARVAELVDAPDLGSGAFGREGSTPFARTIFKQPPTSLSMSSRPWPHGQFIVAVG